ncbi:MAG TPA: hypothetical protein VMF61_03670 [Candidatus Acidoferrales bacterium]|nr:hypothetical protein [Candidatus Acidoferrales bacterium]
MMPRISDRARDREEATMRRQIVAFLEEYCRGMTLREAGEWYDEALASAVNDS